MAGTLLEIKVEEDETVEVGAELAVIGSGDAAPAKSEAKAEEKQPEPEPEPEKQPEKEPEPEPQAEEKQPEPEPEKQPEKAPEPTHAEEPAGGGDGPGYVTPLVRKLATQHGVDLGSVSGTGVGGRIRKQDVLDAAAKAKEAAQPSAPAAPAASAPSAPASSAPSPLRGKTEKISRLRKIIASRMVESLQTSAQLTQVVEVDVTAIARLREAAKADFLAREGVKLSYLPFFAKAAIDSLKEHPSLNATIDTEAGEVTYFDREHVAFAVDTEKGLLTPVVKDAGDLSIAGLAKKIADIAQRTRSNKIGPDELSGGTFTITNLGSVGALWDTPIINKPQVAILGPGTVVKRAVVIDDANLGETIAVRHMVYLALTYDHQLVDGADAGRFLQDVKQRLESGRVDASPETAPTGGRDRWMPLNVVIAGASGFLGTHLSRELVGRGHAVVALVRRPTSAPDESTWDPYSGVYDRDTIERADVVVNLAGTPTIGNPHSKKWARNLRTSRVTTTRVLAEAIAGSERRPAYLAGSAIAWYGDHGGEVVTEETGSTGDSLLTRVTREWQDATAPAVEAGARVCVLRTAPVMDRRSAPLKQLRLLTRLGLGARLGSGAQHMAMVSLRDWTGGVAHLAEYGDVSGPVNLCCPETPTNAEFTAALARAVERRAFLAVPSFAIRLGAGPLAPEALGSLNLRPTVLEETGYWFRDRTVHEVLRTGLS